MDACPYKFDVENTSSTNDKSIVFGRFVKRSYRQKPKKSQRIH